MKILWVVNNLFPQLAEHLGRPIPVVGGWMYGLAKNLSTANLDFTIVTTDPGLEIDRQIEGIRFVLLKTKASKHSYDPSLEEKWKSVIALIQPDLIHIHGTEYALGLPLLTACPNEKYIVSIQGLLSIITRYYYAGMTTTDILSNITIRDLLRFDTIFQAMKKMGKRGDLEKTYLSKIKNVIGRTSWDRDHSLYLNPKRSYFFCNESLRPEFYDVEKWNIDTSDRHSIFISQAGYPLKGFHQVLRAVNLIKSEFENITIRIGGDNVIDKSFMRLTGYGKYIGNLVRKFNLENNVVFLGPLNTNEMIREYLKSRIFICPSSIENSSNSIGEAQLLGVPCIASYVGGTPDMVTHNIDGLLYRFEEIEMLAQNIKTIFTNNDLALRLSKNGIITATKRHDVSNNLKTTLNIYKKLIN